MCFNFSSLRWKLSGPSCAFFYSVPKGFFCTKDLIGFALVLAWIGNLAFSPSVGFGNPTPPPPDLSSLQTSLLYVSDYFSFVGADSQGHVSLAIDNNRGRDGDSWQAEHFVVLHDEHEGWITLQGNGAYENRNKELETIPSSDFFEITGSVESGLSIVSLANDLTLAIDPIAVRIDRAHEGGRYWLGSAAAVLTWNGRTVKGRVIYEYFMMPEFNRLTRSYWGLWKHFQGLYLVVEELGDLYVHSQESDRLAPLVGTLDGFLAIDGTTEPFQSLQLTLLDSTQAWGLFRWPSAWAINWVNQAGAGHTRLQLYDFKSMGNWGIGGFGMGIVIGVLQYNGKEYRVYGLGELIM